MTTATEKRQQRWRYGCSLLSGLSAWAMVGGGGAHLLHNPALGNWLLVGGAPLCLLGVALYMIPVR